MMEVQSAYQKRLATMATMSEEEAMQELRDLLVEGCGHEREFTLTHPDVY